MCNALILQHNLTMIEAVPKPYFLDLKIQFKVG